MKWKAFLKTFVAAAIGLGLFAATPGCHWGHDHDDHDRGGGGFDHRDDHHDDARDR